MTEDLRLGVVFVILRSNHHENIRNGVTLTGFGINFTDSIESRLLCLPKLIAPSNTQSGSHCLQVPTVPQENRADCSLKLTAAAFAYFLFI